MKPSLVIDSDIVTANINKMAEKCKRLGLEWRPHFKTHQSKTIGRWFRTFGVSGITVSSIEMARFFAEDGWTDITIAFPVDCSRMIELEALSEITQLTMITSSLKALEQLSEAHFKQRPHLLIEVDPMNGRSGVDIEDTSALEDLVDRASSLKTVVYKGFYAHAGQTYKGRSAEDVLAIVAPVLRRLHTLKARFPGSVICFGDTPSCSLTDDIDIATQTSPGNLVFYDWIQTRIGSCTPADIGIAMKCTVIELFPKRNQFLIHGGAIHFSKDADVTEDGKPYYGVVAESKGNGWGNPLEGAFLSSISQEHGMVSCTKAYLETLNVGDEIFVLPIHSCLTADCMGGYIDLDGNQIDHFSSVRS
ncbi:MAG: alanine racemase [Bacteroidota bacterium]